MSARCEEIVWRVPAADGQTQDRYAHRQLCGRPVERDGLCSRHLALLSPVDERAWRRALRQLRRG